MFRKIINTIRLWLSKRTKHENKGYYKTIYLEDLPDHLQKDTLYILGEGNHLWSVAMLCPCNCGEILQMSLHPDGRPRWHLITHSNSLVSLRPSIHRKVGCKSHFWLENSTIKWC